MSSKRCKTPAPADCLEKTPETINKSKTRQIGLRAAKKLLHCRGNIQKRKDATNRMGENISRTYQELKKHNNNTSRAVKGKGHEPALFNS